MEISIILPTSISDWKRMLKGQKQWQITKSFPAKLAIPSDRDPVTVYVYNNKVVVGKYCCKKIFCNRWYDVLNDWDTGTIELIEIGAVVNKIGLRSLKHRDIYLWKIENLEVFNSPKTISSFGFNNMSGQWLYVEKTLQRRD